MNSFCAHSSIKGKKNSVKINIQSFYNDLIEIDMKDKFYSLQKYLMQVKKHYIKNINKFLWYYVIHMVQKTMNNCLKIVLINNEIKKIQNKSSNDMQDCGHVFLDYFFLNQKDLENYYQNNNPFEKVEQLDPSHQKVRS